MYIACIFWLFCRPSMKNNIRDTASACAKNSICRIPIIKEKEEVGTCPPF